VAVDPKKRVFVLAFTVRFELQDSFRAATSVLFAMSFRETAARSVPSDCVIQRVEGLFPG
jgi:hypothetical protein